MNSKLKDPFQAANREYFPEQEFLDKHGPKEKPWNNSKTKFKSIYINTELLIYQYYSILNTEREEKLLMMAL